MAGSQDDGQERTQEATQRRLEQAREKGDIARSQDAQAFAAYLGLSLAVALAGTWSAAVLGDAMLGMLAHPQALAAELLHGGTSGALPTLGGQVLLAALPVVALPAALVVALLVAQRGIVFSVEKVQPRLDRVSPVSNAKQKYGLTGLVEFAKSTAKLTAVSAILAFVIVDEFERLSSHVSRPPRSIGALLEAQFWALMTGVLALAAAVAALDLVWQNADLRRRNRMTHQELKEETKQAEGDPHLKAERRERQRAAATNRMMLDVPRADVIVTNPTHYAVALAWDRAPGSAPVCLAKGVDEIALRIRAIAEENDIPLHEDAPTARSIHALVEVGSQILPQHYRAVAAAILFADRMTDEARRQSG